MRLLLASALFAFTASATEIFSGRLSVKASDSGELTLAVDGKPFAVTPSGAKYRKTERMCLESDDMRVEVRAGSPFVFFTAVLRGGGAATVTNRVLYPELKLSDARLNTVLTTGGLRPIDKNPGSYTWTAVADPETRNGIAAGWVTIDRGSGIVRTTNNVVLPHVDMGRFLLKPGAVERLETFAVGTFEDARLGLEAYADAVAAQYRIKLPPMPTVHCTWYVDGASTQAKLGPRTEFTAAELKKFGLDVMQIDDGWQIGIKTNGPKKVFIDYDKAGPYPAGMKPMADIIRSHGMTAGIWLIPFAGTWNDPWFADKQDWFAKTSDGKPFDTRWGGTCYDLTHPGAKAHLVETIDLLVHKWGYKYLKMDGLYTGAAIDLNYICDTFREDKAGDAVLHDPSVTQFQMMRDSLALVRKTAGDDVFLLGCCTPQNMRSEGLAFGRVDAMRIGPDNGANWSAMMRGPEYGAWHYFLHGRVWYNDPDPLYVRVEPIQLSKVLCSWVALSGQMNSSSEEYAKLKPDQLDLLKRTIPSHTEAARPADLFETAIPRIWTLNAAGRNLVGLFNWDAADYSFGYPLAKLGLDPARTYIAFDFWSNGLTEPFSGKLARTLPPQSCEVLSVCEITAAPQVISTSRHITQGVMDLKQVKWNPKTRVLSGESTAVAGDPYELRILIQTVNGAFKPLEVKADLPAVQKLEEGLLRVVFTPEKSGRVKWAVRFSSTEKVDIVPQVTNLKATQSTPFDPVKLGWEANTRCEIKCNGKVRVPSCIGREWTDEAVESEKTYVYEVTPVTLTGVRGAPVQTTFTMPKVPQLGSVPPKPEVFIGDLKPVKLGVGWGSPKFNTALNGPLTLGTAVYKSGICLHADGFATYVRDPSWKRFTAVVGIDESQRKAKQSSITFAVSIQAADGQRVIAVSPVLRFGQREIWYFDVELPADAKEVTVHVQSAGDGNKSDHGNWCDAGFIR